MKGHLNIEIIISSICGNFKWFGTSLGRAYLAMPCWNIYYTFGNAQVYF